VSDAALIAREAARLLRVDGGRVPAVPEAVDLATAVTGLLGVAGSAPQLAPSVQQADPTSPAAAPASRSWWQRLFGSRH
jgi:hypothetical protein